MHSRRHSPARVVTCAMLRCEHGYEELQTLHWWTRLIASRSELRRMWNDMSRTTLECTFAHSQGERV